MEVISMQFSSDMHLEMPLKLKHLPDGIRDCLEAVDESVEGLTQLEGLPRVGKYLALLGDIFDAKKIRNGTYKQYLLQQCVGYEMVFVVAGNHEFYQGEHSKVRTDMEALCSEVMDELGGTLIVHFLDRKCVDIPGVPLRVIGCTLWSEVKKDVEPQIQQGLSDYQYIRVLDADGNSRVATVADTNAWHAEDVKWLENELARATQDAVSCIVLTHHAPTFHKTCSPAHDGSVLSSAFCTDLERILCAPVLAWLFGHSHWSSWQKASIASAPANTFSANQLVWKDLGDSSGPPSEDLFSGEAGQSRLGESVLVASNQLGYNGEHVRSRFHPWMRLIAALDGQTAQLCCSRPS